MKCSLFIFYCKLKKPSMCKQATYSYPASRNLETIYVEVDYIQLSYIEKLKNNPCGYKP